MEKLFVNFPVKLNLPKLNNFLIFTFTRSAVFNDHILDNFNILFLNNEKNKTVNKKILLVDEGPKPLIFREELNQLIPIIKMDLNIVNLEI